MITERSGGKKTDKIHPISPVSGRVETYPVLFGPDSISTFGLSHLQATRAMPLASQARNLQIQEQTLQNCGRMCSTCSQSGMPHYKYVYFLNAWEDIAINLTMHPIFLPGGTDTLSLNSIWVKLILIEADESGTMSPIRNKGIQLSGSVIREFKSSLFFGRRLFETINRSIKHVVKTTYLTAFF